MDNECREPDPMVWARPPVEGRSWIWRYCHWRIPLLAPWEKRPLTAEDIDRTRVFCLLCRHFVTFQNEDNMIDHMTRVHGLDPNNLPPPPPDHGR